MFYKIIIIYLISIVCAVFIKPDIHFVLFLLFIILSFMASMSFIKDRGHLKDKKTLIKDMSFISLFTFVFYLTSIYTEKKLDGFHETINISNMKNQLEFTGRVVSLERKSTGNTLVLENRDMHSEQPKYIQTSVSQNAQISLYDALTLSGQINIKNWEVFSPDKQLFESYEYEKIFYNTPYIVSFPKILNVKNSNETFLEKVYKKFVSKSETIYLTLSKYMSEPYASIASGISFGASDNINKDIKDIFINSGLIHIMVLSGANVSFIISIIWYFARRLKSKYKIFYTIFISWIFILSTGLTAPSVRAGVMSSTNILSEYFGKNISTMKSILMAVLILTFLNPLTLVYSASLHLSFLATLGIFILSPWLEKKFIAMKYLKSGFLNFMLVTSISITLCTTPYILAMTGKTGLFGNIFTILLEPFVFTNTVLSFLIILFDQIYLKVVANILGIINTGITKIILNVAEFGANNFQTINFQLPTLFIIFYYLILFFILFKIDSSKNDIMLENKNHESK